VVWVADRGFASAENRRYRQRGGGSYIIGEKLRGDSPEAAAALARQGRYREVAQNLEVEEVVIDDGVMRDRFVICRNPEAAERDRIVRDQLLAPLTDAIDDTDGTASVGSWHETETASSASSTCCGTALFMRSSKMSWSTPTTGTEASVSVWFTPPVTECMPLDVSSSTLALTKTFRPSTSTHVASSPPSVDSWN
jgi:hypothetical protein